MSFQKTYYSPPWAPFDAEDARNAIIKEVELDIRAEAQFQALQQIQASSPNRVSLPSQESQQERKIIMSKALAKIEESGDPWWFTCDQIRIATKHDFNTPAHKCKQEWQRTVKRIRSGHAEQMPATSRLAGTRHDEEQARLAARKDAADSALLNRCGETLMEGKGRARREGPTRMQEKTGEV